jgi:hydroxypyruvate isomerase
VGDRLHSKGEATVPVPKISACIEMLFREVEFNDRPARAAECGCDAVEFWGHGNKDIPAFMAACRDAGLPVACCGGTGASLVDPGTEEKATADLRASIALAKEHGIPTLIATTGQEIEGLRRDTQHANIVKRLKAVAEEAGSAGVTLVLEPLNIKVDHKGYYLDTSAEGLEILQEVGSPAVKLLYDIYHQQITEGDLIRTLTSNVERIGHVHLADHPGRGEPGTGEINCRNVVRALGEAGYAGYVGLEYRPEGDSAESVKRTLDLLRG